MLIFNYKKVKGVKSMLKISRNNSDLLDSYLIGVKLAISSKPISNKLLQG